MRTRLLASLALFIGWTNADAMIMAFNVPTSETIFTTAEVDGFLFTSEHFHLMGDGYFASNGTTYLSYESGRGRPITMSLVGGGTFALRGFDGAEAVTTSPQDRPAAEAIRVVGYRADGSTVTAELWLDAVHDGGSAGSANDFQPFTLSGAFSNLTSVVFTGIRTDGRDGGIALDNLDIETGASTGDTSPPTVSVSSPGPGVVSGSITVVAVAGDNVGVSGVQFKLDGVSLGSADTQSPYEITWDTTSVADGAHTISAEARDAANNVGSSSVVVTVSNGALSGLPFFMDFDGVNDYLDVADASNLTFGNGFTDAPFTIEAWFMPDTMSVKQNLIGKWGNNANQEYKLYIAANTIRLDLKDSTRQAIVSAYTMGSQASLVGSWHHLGVTYDGRGGAAAAGGITFYIDGVSVPLTRTNSASYVAMVDSAATLQIGRESAQFKQYFGGLDEIRIWNVLRTQSQIQSRRFSEVAGTEPGLVAYWKMNEAAGSSLADSSSGGNPATAHNGPTWVAGGIMEPPVVDTNPPAISNVVANSLTDTSVTIAFSTDETATGWVSYSAGVSCPCVDVYSQGPGTVHSIRLTSLAPSTMYQYTPKAVDAAGNLRVGPVLNFTTLAPPPDTVSPTVSVTSPTTSTVFGTITMGANATDNVGVVGVQFKLDGVNVGAEDTTAPYSISWDSTAVADGSHTITAEARDASSNVGSSSMVVSVSNHAPVSTPYFLAFDGVNDYVAVAGPVGLSFGNGLSDTPLTIETWFRPNSMTTKQNLIGRWGSSADQEYKLYIAAGTIRFDLRDSTRSAIVSAYTTDSQAALTGGWHHVAVTYDGRGGAAAANGITIYVDGAPVRVTRLNSTSYVAMQQSTASLQIGRESPSFKQYNGALDEMRLWNVAHTQGQIQTHMTSEMAAAEAGLVAYWKFNEGTGVAAADSSQTGNLATIFNGPAWNPGGPFGP